MNDIHRAYEKLSDGTIGVLFILVHAPWCGVCKGYYSDFNEICEKMPELCGEKGIALSIPDDEADETMGFISTVPHVILASRAEDGTINEDKLDHITRSSYSVIPAIEELMGKYKQSSNNDSDSDSDSSSDSDNDNDNGKGTKKKVSKKTGKTGKTGKSRKMRRHEQKGEGFIESALAATFLGGAVVATNKSSTVKKYIKQASDGLIKLSKASSKLAKGTMKVLSEQEMMKKLSNVTSSLTRKLTRKVTRKSKGKGTRKN